MIASTDLDSINTRFRQLVTNKITLPLQKYNEERGYVSQFKRWASDTLKTIFGVGKISTYATLFNMSKDKTDLFDLGIGLSKMELKK